MTENEWWSRYIKPRWHNLSNRWVARKVQDVTNKGAPDVDACWNGYQCKVELKYRPIMPSSDNLAMTFSRYSKDEPNRRTVLSREQVRNLEEWHDAGGNAYVLVGVDKAWFFMPIRVVMDYNYGLNMYQLRTWSTLSGDSIKTIDSVPDHFANL